MPYYSLDRANDKKTFTALRENDEAALLYFSILVGEALTFNGCGDPPYLLGRRAFSVKPVKTATPVYRAGV